jgi:hypothetical protein
VVRQPAEERLVIEVLGGGLAGADGVDAVAERRRCVSMNMMATSRIEPGWPLTSVCPSEVSEEPGSVLVTRLRPASVTQPVQRRRVRGTASGQDLRRRRAGHELIGGAQYRGGIKRLGDPEPAQEQDHLRGRRKFVSLHGSPFDGSPRLASEHAGGYRVQHL